jgi:SAM-dependent methyltransferase
LRGWRGSACRPVAGGEGEIEDFDEMTAAVAKLRNERPVANSAVRPNSCIVCGDASENVVFREGSYEGRLCACGVVYTHPLPPAGAVDFTADAHPEQFYAHSAEYKAEWMARRCPPGRLLEIGCGRGAFLAAARRRGFDVCGLEPHPDRAAAAEALGIPIHREFLDATTLPRRSFDIVYHCDLLSHFVAPDKALRDMAELLGPEGVLCFEAGLLGCVANGWHRAIRKIGLEHHLWLYTEPALRRLIEQAGLQIVSMQAFGLSPALFLGRASALAAKAVGAALTGTGTRIGRNAASQVADWQHRFRHILRYPVGAWSPKIGPQTVLFVARPVAARSSRAA